MFNAIQLPINSACRVNQNEIQCKINGNHDRFWFRSSTVCFLGTLAITNTYKTKKIIKEISPLFGQMKGGL